MNEISVIQSLSDIERVAEAMAASGYFSDARQAAQAVVKILAGREMGFGPFSSMSGVHIIQGRPTIGANLMAAAVKASARYDYRVLKMTDEVVEIEFFDSGQSIGVSTFTLADARRAGTKNLDKFPRNMLFARAMSNGVRWYVPDVFSGNAVYTPEELGAETDEEGRVIDASVYAVETEPEPAAHWIENPEVRKRFWAWAEGLGLSHDDVHAALGVTSVKEYGGTMLDARTAIENWIADQTSGILPDGLDGVSEVAL